VIVSLPKSTNALESPVRSASGPHRKAKPDLFTVLLALALVAVLTAILFLWLEVKAYDYKSTGAPTAMMDDSHVPLLRRSSAERNSLPRHCLFQAVAHDRVEGAFHALYATRDRVCGSSLWSS
jgi:hypothetical protein